MLEYVLVRKVFAQLITSESYRQDTAQFDAEDTGSRTLGAI